jgi:putative MATE family efflux protein
MGVAGSAIGAASARTLGGLIIVALLLRGRSGLRLNLQDFSPDWVQIKRILNIGLPAGGEMMFMRFGQTAFAMVVAGLGTASFAAHQLALQSESISFMPGFGFAVAATTLVGQELGAKNPRRAQESGYAALRLAIAVMSVMGLVFFAFAPQFLGFFIDDPEVIGLGVTPLRMVAVFQVPLAAAMVLSGGLRGAGDTRWTMLITAAGLWLLRVPLSLILTTALGLGLVGAWMAMGVDLVARGSAAYWRFNNGGWAKLKV